MQNNFVPILNLQCFSIWPAKRQNQVYFIYNFDLFHAILLWFSNITMNSSIDDQICQESWFVSLSLPWKDSRKESKFIILTFVMQPVVSSTKARSTTKTISILSTNRNNSEVQRKLSLVCCCCVLDFHKTWLLKARWMKMIRLIWINLMSLTPFSCRKSICFMLW